jgi:hypothetical protein
MVCKNKYIQSILNPFTIVSYYTSYMTKINKLVTSKLHSIIQKCILGKNDTNIKIQKLSNIFINVQEMFAQLTAYLVFKFFFISFIMNI